MEDGGCGCQSLQSTFRVVCFCNNDCNDDDDDDDDDDYDDDDDDDNDYGQKGRI